LSAGDFSLTGLGNCFSSSTLLKKSFGMLRGPQHERKTINDRTKRPFVLSPVEGLR
jgi:hypothetical protein